MACRSSAVAHFATNELRKAKSDTEAFSTSITNTLEGNAPWTLATAWGFQHITISDKLQSDDWFTTDICGPTTKQNSTPRAPPRSCGKQVQYSITKLTKRFNRDRRLLRRRVQATAEASNTFGRTSHILTTCLTQHRSNTRYKPFKFATSTVPLSRLLVATNLALNAGNNVFSIARCSSSRLGTMACSSLS